MRKARRGTVVIEKSTAYVLRAFTGLCWIGGAIMIALSPWILIDMRDADGNLEPFLARLLLALLLLGTGLLCTVGMWIYLRLAPIHAIWRDDEIVFEFPRLFGSKTQAIPVADMLGSQSHTGKIYTPRVSVDNSYMTVRVRNWWFPLIIETESARTNVELINHAIATGERQRGARRES
jgi:hypothetical protein